jgi:hypothetical protein
LAGTQIDMNTRKVTYPKMCIELLKEPTIVAVQIICSKTCPKTWHSAQHAVTFLAEALGSFAFIVGRTDPTMKHISFSRPVL